MQREIHLFRSWNTVPCAQNLKPKFEFKTLLAQNFPAGTSELIPFGANWDLRWSCPAGTLELIMFGARSDLLWDLKFPEIPSQGFLLVFPRWGLLCLFVFVELHISPLEIYYSSPFLGNYINHQRTRLPKFFLTQSPTTYIY